MVMRRRRKLRKKYERRESVRHHHMTAGVFEVPTIVRTRELVLVVCRRIAKEVMRRTRVDIVEEEMRRGVRSQFPRFLISLLSLFHYLPHLDFLLLLLPPPQTRLLPPLQLPYLLPPPLVVTMMMMMMMMKIIIRRMKKEDEESRKSTTTRGAGSWAVERRSGWYPREQA